MSEGRKGTGGGEDGGCSSAILRVCAEREKLNRGNFLMNNALPGREGEGGNEHERARAHTTSQKERVIDTDVVAG